MKTTFTKFLMGVFAFGFFQVPAFGQTFTGFEIDAGWSLPTQIGARFKAFLNNTTYLAAGAGYSPGFTSGATEFMTIGPSKEGSFILSQSLYNSFVIDLRAGYQEKVDEGLYFEGGYNYFTGGKGSVTETDIAEYDIALTPSFGDYEVKSSLHALAAWAGYVFKMSGLVLKAEVGLVKPLSSDNSFDAESGFVSPFLKDAIEDEMTDLWGQAFIFNAGLHVIIPLK